MIDVSMILSTTFDLEELIHRVLETSQRVMNSEASNVMLLNEETGLLECKVALGKVSDQLKGEFTLEMGQGIAGWVAQHGQGQVVTDTRKDKRFFSFIQALTYLKYKKIAKSLNPLWYP